MTLDEGDVKGKKQKCVKLKDGTKVFNPNDDIEKELYTNYAEMFMTGKTSSNTYLSTLISKSLNRIEFESGKDATTALGAVRELNRIATKTAEYFDKSKKADVDFSRYLLRDGLFEWQRKVYDSHSKKKTMLCGRRSGKSFSVVDLALHHCLETGKKQKQAAIIGLTTEKTAAIYWDNIKTHIEKAHIPTAKIDNGGYRVVFSNGNILQLFGNNSKAEREKLRGYDLSFVAIDECQSQAGLYYLIDSIIMPMLRGQDGELILLGTAPLYAGTYWENAILSDTFEHFHATMEDNPTIPDYTNALKNVLEENHWSEDNITFRREYLGEIAYDTERLIYPHRTYYEELPADYKPIGCVIGVDFGWRDYSSFAPILYDSEYNCYLIDEWKQNKTAATALVDKAKAITEAIHTKYNIPIEDIKIVADSSHQQISADFYNQGIINIQNAYKQDEQYQIARVAEACEIGLLNIQKNKPFDIECNSLVWKWNDEKACVVYAIDDDVFHPDIADSVKYAYTTIIQERNMV